MIADFSPRPESQKRAEDDIVTFEFKLPRDEFNHLLQLAALLEPDWQAKSYLRTLIQREWDTYSYLVPNVPKEESR